VVLRELLVPLGTVPLYRAFPGGSSEEHLAGTSFGGDIGKWLQLLFGLLGSCGVESGGIGSLLAGHRESWGSHELLLRTRGDLGALEVWLQLHDVVLIRNPMDGQLVLRTGPHSGALGLLLRLL
jgi:hypothetical protein